METPENKVPAPSTPAPKSEGDLSTAPVIGPSFIPKPDATVPRVAATAPVTTPVAPPLSTPAAPPAPGVVPPPPPVTPVPLPKPTTPIPLAPVAPVPVVPPTPPAVPVVPPASPQSGAGHVDLGKVLLPKKEVHGSQSAQRVNAAEVLASEATPMARTAPEIAAMPAPVKPAGEESSVKPLQTFRSDIEKVVEGKNVSVVSIAAAEAARRDTAGTANAHASTTEVAQQPSQAPQDSGRTIWLSVSMLIGGVLMLGAGGGALAYFLSIPTSTPIAVSPQAPFIAVDETKVIELQPGTDTFRRGPIMSALEKGRKETKIPLGLVNRLLPVVGSGNSAQEIAAPDFLYALMPSIPQELLRTLEPVYLLGVHSFDENQSFLILRADLYEVAYGAMLKWERTLFDDLTPLFVRTPSLRIEDTPVVPVEPALSTSTASSTVASTTPGAAPSRIVQTIFIDKVIENRDTRSIVNEAGDVLLLWTFLDRNTILITTNEYTLREIINRTQNASIVPIQTQ